MEQEGSSFIQEIIAEAEANEKKLEQAHIDLILLEIRDLNSQVENTFDQANRECELIKSFALRKNSSTVSKIEFLEKKLEAYLKEENLKTLQLAHGEIKLRKSPPRVEITDMTELLKHVDASVLDEIPSTIKVNLTKLRSYISRTGKIPKGCTSLEGETKFHYKIYKEDMNEQPEAQTGFGNQSPSAA